MNLYYRNPRKTKYTITPLSGPPPARIDFTGVVILNNVDEVLLVYNHKADCYTTPGGKCEPGETSEEAAIREVIEEVGVFIDPKDLQLIGFSEIYKDEKFLGSSAQYYAKKWSGEAKNLEPSKHRELRWFRGRDGHDIDPIIKPFMYAIQSSTKLPVYYKVEINADL